MWVGQMHPNSLPIINLRYWLIILVASMCGTTIGDLLSQTLNLGFLGGPLILAVFFWLFYAASICRGLAVRSTIGWRSLWLVPPRRIWPTSRHTSSSWI